MTSPLIIPSEFLGLDNVAHLCAAGEAPMLRSHLDAFTRYSLDKSDGMPGRQRLLDAVDATKEMLAGLVRRPSGDIALLAHASEGVNVVAQTLDWRAGDNVVVADVEFPSSIYPWLSLEHRGVEVRVVRSQDLLVQIADLRAAVDRRTRLVAVSHVSYLTGQRLHLPSVAELAWQAGARLLVDATHSLGVVDVDANGCDFLVSSCYKWLLGVHGVGIFVWNRSRVPDAPPVSLGWHSVTHHAGVDNPTRLDLRPDAGRFEAGNPSFSGIYVLRNALDRLTQVPAKAVERHALALGTRVRDGLLKRGVPVITPESTDQRAGNVCCSWKNAEAFARLLAERGVLIWGSEGRLRISTHVYNSSDDVDRFFAVFDDVRTRVPST